MCTMHNVCRRRARPMQTRCVRMRVCNRVVNLGWPDFMILIYVWDDIIEELNYT